MTAKASRQAAALLLAQEAPLNHDHPTPTRLFGIQLAMQKNPAWVRRVKKIRDFIRRHPKHLHMENWFSLDGVGRYGAATCGTTGCIAGWYGLFRPGAKPDDWRDEVQVPGLRTPVHVAELMVADLFKVSPSSLYIRLLRHLYHTEHWPEPFRSQYARLNDRGRRQEQAHLVARRITFFLKTGR